MKFKLIRRTLALGLLVYAIATGSPGATQAFNAFLILAVLTSWAAYMYRDNVGAATVSNSEVDYLFDLLMIGAMFWAGWWWRAAFWALVALLRPTLRSHTA